MSSRSLKLMTHDAQESGRRNAPHRSSRGGFCRSSKDRPESAACGPRVQCERETEQQKKEREEENRIDERQNYRPVISHRRRFLDRRDGSCLTSSHYISSGTAPSLARSFPFPFSIWSPVTCPSRSTSVLPCPRVHRTIEVEPSGCSGIIRREEEM